MSSIGSSTTVYVISGTNRGIGLGLVEQLALRADACIYAGVRDISKADKLQQLAKQHSNVRIMQLSAESDEDHTVLQKQVEAEAGRVDVVIANAGIAIYEKTGKITLANARTMYEVNFLGPVRLFQSLLPLLALSSNPRFVSISSAVGSITLQPTIGAFAVGAYGGTKVALNLLVQRIHVEHTSLTAFVVNPGWVQSDAGNFGARLNGMEQAPTSVEDSCKRVLQFVFDGKRDTHSGKFWNADDGAELPW